jgi:hypothetical protein
MLTTTTFSVPLTFSGLDEIPIPEPLNGAAEFGASTADEDIQDAIIDDCNALAEVKLGQRSRESV